MDDSSQRDPRVYFAAERTFMAWIRTGLGLMGVGFAVARFGLFLREMRAGVQPMPGQPTGLSVWAGVALVALGVTVNVAATVHHVRLTRQLREGVWIPGRSSRLAVILSLLLAAVGIALGIYLIVLR